jgi:glycosyltransferase involved in cell wall biosynthesis
MVAPLSLPFLSLTARWLAGWYLGARPRQLATGPPAAPPTRVSVIVPARDEAHVLDRLLASLRAQESAPYEVIVVDDDSSDGTAGVALAGGAEVVSAPPLPAGWAGKPSACAAGAARATGELLVFVDADVWCEPAWLGAIVAAHRSRGGLVSVQPYHRMERPYERLSACCNLVAVMGTGASSLRNGARITGAFGPCLAISRADYDAIGGHSAVGREVLDDVALARLAHEHRRPVHALTGGRLVSFRMYPRGVRQLVEGWSKNIALGAGSTPWPRMLAIVAWMSGVLEAGWWTWAGAVSAPFGNSFSAVHAAFYGLFALQLAVLLRQLGNFGATALMFPLVAASFVVIFFRSLLMTARGEVRWKGRRISTRVRAGA